MRKLLPVLAVAATVLCNSAFAHGIWVAQRLDLPTIIYGHLAEDGSYDPAKVTSVVGYSAAGTEAPVEIIRADKNVGLTIPEGTAVLTTTFDNGFWVKGSDGAWQNVGKVEVPGGTESHQPLKYNTHVLAAVDGSFPRTGAALEIVPLVDPTGLNLGDDLPVQVFLNGEPYANAQVINDYINDAHRTVMADLQGNAPMARKPGLT